MKYVIFFLNFFINLFDINYFFSIQDLNDMVLEDIKTIHGVVQQNLEGLTEVLIFYFNFYQNFRYFIGSFFFFIRMIKQT